MINSNNDYKNYKIILIIQKFKNSIFRRRVNFCVKINPPLQDLHWCMVLCLFLFITPNKSDLSIKNESIALEIIIRVQINVFAAFLIIYCCMYSRLFIYSISNIWCIILLHSRLFDVASQILLLHSILFIWITGSNNNWECSNE